MSSIRFNVLVRYNMSNLAMGVPNISMEYNIYYIITT